MRAILKNAEKKAKSLLKATRYRREALQQVSKNQGVYLVRHMVDGIIYVGKGSNLKRRLLGEHLSGEKSDTTSNLRRKLARRYHLKPGPGMKKWMLENLSFSWIEVSDKDETILVEALMIAYLRNKLKNECILNA